MLRYVKWLSILGIIGLLLPIPKSYAGFSLNPFTGKMDKTGTTSSADILAKSVGGDTLWTRDSSLDILPMTTIQSGLLSLDTNGDLTPISTVSVGLWQLDSNYDITPNSEYNVDGLWELDSNNDLYERQA